MEPGSADLSTAGRHRTVPWRLLTAATLLMLGTVALIWFAAVPIATGVCPAIDPPPTNCQPSFRAGSGLIATIITVGIWAATITIALLWHRRAARPFVVPGVVLLALAPAVTYLAVAWSPGFTFVSGILPRVADE